MGILQNCKLFFGAYDLSGDTNRIELIDTPDMLDDTVFGDAAKSRTKGLENISLNGQGFLNLGEGNLEAGLMSNWSVQDIPITIGYLIGVAGEVGHFFLGSHSEFQSGGKIGDMLPYRIKAEGRDFPLLRGTILHNATRLINGVGTAFQVGAVLASQKLYGILHVIAIPGAAPTLDIIVQSDSLETFLSPTTRITFIQKTAIGYQWATPVDGAITDDWWRVSYTLGGTITSATFVVAIAIL